MSGVTRRSTFKPGTSDIFTRYQSIKNRAERCIAFIEAECLVPEGRGTGKPYVLRPWQKRIIRKALGRGVMVAVLSGPRGLTKTGLAAPIAVWALYDREAAQVQVVSTGMRAAKKPYGRAVRIIETNPDLVQHAMIFRNTAEPFVELPARGAKMEPLPAEEKYIVGGSPTLIIVDEFGYVDRPTYETMQTSLGKTDESFLFAMGTPGLGIVGTDDQPNLMYEFRTRALADNPPDGLVFIEFAARPQDPPGHRTTWKRANPGAGDLVGWREIKADYETMPASRFAQMRLGMWSQHETAWMSLEPWEALPVVHGAPAPGTVMCLGFDGSTSGDGTALWGYEYTRSRLVRLGYWQRDPQDRHWQVPREEVMSVIDRAFTDHQVLLMLMDPWHWRTEAQELARRYGDRVQEFNTASSSRMGPAADGFLTSVMKREIVTDGDAVLTAHILAAVAKRTQAGDVIVKDARTHAHIDAAIAAILARHAATLAPPPGGYGSW